MCRFVEAKRRDPTVFKGLGKEGEITNRLKHYLQQGESRTKRRQTWDIGRSRHVGRGRAKPDDGGKLRPREKDKTEPDVGVKY